MYRIIQMWLPPIYKTTNSKTWHYTQQRSYNLKNITSMDLKELMLEYFERPQVNSLILAYAEEHKLDYQSLSNDQLMDILDQLQILEPLMSEMNSHNPKQSNNMYSMQNEELEDISTSTSLKNLKVWIQRGRKFKMWNQNLKGDKFFVSLAIFGQKFRTNSRPIAESFTVGQQFVFTAENKQLKTNNNQLIELAIIIQTKQGTRRIYSMKMVEWRYVLAHGSVTFDIELAPYYHEGVGEMSAVGILSLKLQLYPLSKLNMVQPTTIDKQIQLEMKNKQKYNNQFYAYANMFWNQYKQVHKSFQSRRIKIYGDSDDKIFIPLCRFVCPLYSVRGIDSPQHALRFCSLIPFEEEKMNRQTCHKRFHSMIAGMQGTVDDHCHLLCSFLLGFGLKAYVCIGYSYKGQHSWVISEDAKNGSIIFWQCTKGTKYDFFSPKVYDIFKSIHVVYNHNEFYANIQLDDSIAGTKYKFKDSTLWKSIDPSYLQNVPLYNTQIALTTPTFDVIKIENNIENAISQRIQEFRKLNKLGFNRDNILASILSTALSNYEVERVTGLTFCQNEFESAIKNYIPQRHTFKAFPIQLTTLNPDAIIQTLKNQPKCRQIMLSNGDSVYFGIRTKLVVYPDNIFALWLSIGVRYFKLTA